MHVPGTTTMIALLVVLAAGLHIWQDQPDEPVAPASASLMDRPQMLAEYHALADSYPWPLPTGVAFPSTLPEPAELTVYEVGEGRNQADSFWICAWIGEWLSVRVADGKRADVAWAWLQRADQTQLHRENYDDPRDVWHTLILEPAGRGDVVSLHEFYATSCGFVGLRPARAL